MFIKSKRVSHQVWTRRTKRLLPVLESKEETTSYHYVVERGYFPRLVASGKVASNLKRFSDLVTDGIPKLSPDGTDNKSVTLSDQPGSE